MRINCYGQREPERERAQIKIKKSTILLWVSGLFFAFIMWCMCFTMISPGYVGVVVNLFGDSKGVMPQELHVGAHWIAPWKKIYEFPIFEQNITWEGKNGFNFQTKEGMAVHGDVGITFHLSPDHVPIIFQRYRRGMDEISHVFIRNYIRDAINLCASKIEIESLYSSGKEEFFRMTQELVQRDLKPLGIEVNRIYLMGRFAFPENVIMALNAKIEATQRAQQRENELREAEAQARKEVATAEGRAKCVIMEAEAESEANNIINFSLTPELIEWQKIQKWDGKLPTVTGAATPMVVIK